MPDELRDAVLYIPDVGINDKKARKDQSRSYLKGVLSPTLKFRDVQAMLDSQSKVQTVPLEVSSQVEQATDVSSIVHLDLISQGQCWSQ
jgi:hypothetical protein